MTDKPHACFALPGHGLVTLEGRDAVAFSHAQFMSDVKSLGDGGWQWSGWLTPKGRVIALFALLRRNGESVWLVVPDADVATLADGLRRFVFRSKVVIQVVDMPIAGAFAAAPVDGGLPLVALDMSGEGGARTLFIGGEPPVEDADALARWTASDLAHGLPRLPPAQAEKWTPQQLSLERLRAFSVKKGCYPGQEIVARTHFLGQAKRGLVLLEGDAPLAVGAEVVADGTALGAVVSACQRLALSVLPNERDTGALEVAGVRVRELPLLDGLAR